MLKNSREKEDVLKLCCSLSTKWLNYGVIIIFVLKRSFADYENRRKEVIPNSCFFQQTNIIIW